jgi:hypothetical protein
MLNKIELLGDSIFVNDRYAIYSDGCVYDTIEAKDIPPEIFDIRDKYLAGKLVKYTYDVRYYGDSKGERFKVRLGENLPDTTMALANESFADEQRGYEWDFTLSNFYAPKRVVV